MMLRMLACCPLLMLLPAAAPSPRAPVAAADAAGNRMVRFAAVLPPGSREAAGLAHARYCTADRGWCARVRTDEDGHRQLEVSQGMGPARMLDMAGAGDEDSEVGISPRLVSEAAGAVLIRVELTRATGYSGGGARGVRTILVRAEPGSGPLQRVLDVPEAATRDVRACFGPRDTRRRRNACSDQYGAGLALDPATRAGRPRFIYSSRAQTYPGRRTAASDSTVQPPLRRWDLRWWRDPACTFQRRFAFDAAAGRYSPDRPLPACADYLDF
jgi:hypothetical protein